MINRVRLYLGDPDDDGNERKWIDWAEKTARELERDRQALDAGEMSVEEFDEKW